MELYYDILYRAHNNTMASSLNSKEISAIVESQCYQALSKIQGILQDDTLNDSECFLKIEEIVSVFEELGSHCGNRHDFG